ncbi:hypothetical protein [Microbaculum marinum]|uniref:Uncharacterized protein n=1 Tax=Microbaculum marinum TaxID=1764581 RepID=A0AAW9RRI9_9HYPH
MVAVERQAGGELAAFEYSGEIGGEFHRTPKAAQLSGIWTRRRRPDFRKGLKGAGTPQLSEAHGFRPEVTGARMVEADGVRSPALARQVDERAVIFLRRPKDRGEGCD